MQKRAEKCTKKHGARAKKVVVLLIKPIVFLNFSLPSASLDLKYPVGDSAEERKREGRERGGGGAAMTRVGR